MPLVQIQTEIIPAYSALTLQRSGRMYSQRKIMKEGFAELEGLLQTQGLKRAGDPFMKYVGIDFKHVLHRSFWESCKAMINEAWTLELGIPTSDQGAELSEIKPQRAVTALHRGPYWGSIGKSYLQLYHIINNEEYQLDGDVTEVFLTDPQRTKPKDLVTKIIIPILGE